VGLNTHLTKESQRWPGNVQAASEPSDLNPEKTLAIVAAMLKANREVQSDKGLAENPDPWI
jgi:hypothetical protein